MMMPNDACLASGGDTRVRLPLLLMVCVLTSLLSASLCAEQVADKRLFLAPEVIAQLDSPNHKQPLHLPDLSFESDVWLHFYGSMRRGKQTHVFINQQWISKPTKLHGILISPQKLSDTDALPVNIAGETVWLSPGQGVRLRDQRVE